MIMGLFCGGFVVLAVVITERGKGVEGGGRSVWEGEKGKEGEKTYTVRRSPSWTIQMEPQTSCTIAMAKMAQTTMGP